MKKLRDRIVDKYQFPHLALIRFLEVDERACTFLPEEVCFYKSYFQYGLCFPVHPFYREVLSCLKNCSGITHSECLEDNGVLYGDLVYGE